MNPTPAVLYGESVRLEPLDHPHAEDLLAAAADPTIWRHLAVPQPGNVEQLRAWIDEAWQIASTGDQLPFAIVDPRTDRAVGATRFMEIRRAWRTLEIGYTWIAASVQHTAVNTETKYLLLKHCFEDLGALRVQFKVDVKNEPSQRAIERIGAVKEGLHRKQRVGYDGVVRDVLYYSIIDEEWPAVKQKLEVMLAR